MGATLVTAFVLMSIGSRPLCGETPLSERVLVVYNSADPESRSVARYYMEQRHIPDGNRCAIAPSSIDYIRQSEYESRVRTPVRRCIETIGKQKVLYIVFAYHTPYVVQVNDRGFALDSFVSDLWDEYSPTRPGNEMPGHPYFGEAQSQGNVYAHYVPFAAFRDRPGSPNIYVVWRLDAANANLAKGLVEKALLAEANGLSGRACFDMQYEAVENLPDYGSVAGDWDIHQAADFARRAGFEVVEDNKQAEFGTAPAPLRCDGAALYAGWYSLNHYNDAFSWVPGAIGLHLDSASAANPRGGSNWAANAVMRGITITSGAAAEPYLEGLAHPDQVFLYLFEGANAGDALLRSTRWLKWMILNIGDPLYRPFPKGAPTKASLDRQSSLALLPQSVAAGTSADGALAISTPALEGGTLVNLSSSRAEVVSVPKTVTIPAKGQTARFPIITHPVDEDTVAVRISMSVGELRRSNTMTVHACMPPLLFSEAKIKGGAQVMGTVSFFRTAPADGFTVRLSSGRPGVASVPQEVRVPAGASRASFPITTLPTATESSVAISATIAACTRSGTLTVLP
jgi:uncharacterized protein (TIGR03790 family)